MRVPSSLLHLGSLVVGPSVSDGGGVIPRWVAQSLPWQPLWKDSPLWAHPMGHQVISRHRGRGPAWVCPPSMGHQLVLATQGPGWLAPPPCLLKPNLPL